MIVGELLLIILIISIGIFSFCASYYSFFEPGEYKVLGNEKYFFGILFIILGIILISIAIDLYFYFTEGINIIKTFWEMEV